MNKIQIAYDETVYQYYDEQTIHNTMHLKYSLPRREPKA